MVLLFLGHNADALRGLHRLREILKPVRAAQDLDGAPFGIGSLDDVPPRLELCEQRANLLVVERRHAAATRNADPLGELAHAVRRLAEGVFLPFAKSRPMASLPSNAVLLAFEGPDPYSMVGGLGTRVTELSAALAAAEVNTTLIFVGDPRRPPVERPLRNLEYRRWCQWISAHHPGSVYDGEVEKMNDYTVSVPPFVVDEIVAPAVHRGESVLIVAEDWQTVPCALTLDALLRERDLRECAGMMWNANNTYGFETIDWSALSSAARITTVSRYMKFELAARGADALVIPNGIPKRLLGGAPKKLVRCAEKLLRNSRPLFVKVARFEEDKRWMQVIEAFAALHARHPHATLLVRGGREAYGNAIFERARDLDLWVEYVSFDSRDPRAVLETLARAQSPVVNIQSYVPEEVLLALYRIADAVLANSGREPFGLVGLEVMAVGGVAVTGSTGEDYVAPFENAIACDTGEPHELAIYLDELVKEPKLAKCIRAGGKATAKRFTWPRVLEILSRKLTTS
jgi:glycosyltransferase involved in cell wall biosynthesis